MKHLQLLIFHQSISLEELILFSEYLERNPDVSITLNVLSTEDSLQKLLQTVSGTYQLTSMSINALFVGKNSNICAFPILFFDMVRLIAESEQDVHLPKISLKKNAVDIIGTMIYTSDQKIHALSCEDTKNLLHLMGKSQKKLYKLKLSHDSSSRNTEENQILLTITNAKSSFQSSIDGEEPAVHIRIREKLRLEQYAPFEKLDDQTLKKIKVDYEQQLTDDLLRTIALIQQDMRANILGIAQHIERKHPRYWKKHKQTWNQLYPELKITIEVHAKIDHTGLTRDMRSEPRKELKSE